MITTVGPALAESCALVVDVNSGYTPDRAIHYGRMIDHHLFDIIQPHPGGG